MTCKCIETINKKLKALYKRKLASSNFVYPVPDLEMRVAIPTEPIEGKAKESFPVMASFCPFCGKKQNPTRA